MWLYSAPAVICLTVLNGVFPASSRSARDALPVNMTANALFQPALERMWQLSPTFRRQCRRLSAAPQLHVHLLLEELARHPASYHARAAMRQKDGVLVSADIHLARFADPVELIAHEIEHVIEQLDGVDLQAHARSGTVSKRDDGAFETRRASVVGRRVAREVAESANAATPPNVQIFTRPGALRLASYRSCLVSPGASTRSATNCTETETRKVERTGAHNCRSEVEALAEGGVRR